MSMYAGHGIFGEDWMISWWSSRWFKYLVESPIVRRENMTRVEEDEWGEAAGPRVD